MAGSQTVAKAARRAPGGIGFFERYLSLWVALCIVVGIVLGKLLPGAVHTVSTLELAHVNIPVGILIWVMIIPMLLRIDFASLGKVRTQLRGIGVTLVINWAVK
ncbi:arsenic resistance protein, partial [Paraburkholderia graminis]|uniref:arsenic resistance protein n=1 Tax=Paraburkholderia graminis TaxID=60548 RepID=UPI00389B2879